MISVIVPIRNAERHLPELLDSLVRQTCDRPWEIVAVDNGSVDRSVAMVRQFGDRLPLSVVSAGSRPNLARARNTGVRTARGDGFLFVDADDAVSENYVSEMSAALDRQAFVTSRIDCDTLNASWLRGAHGRPWQQTGVSVFYDFMPGTGANVGIRRTAFETAGGFSESLNGAEDVGFSWTARRAGLDVGFVPEAVYRYRYRDSLRGLFRQTVNWGVASVRLYAEFREAGMPGRTLPQAAGEWMAVGRDLLHARNRADLAALTVRAGLCAGRLCGSLRYRQHYL